MRRSILLLVVFTLAARGADSTGEGREYISDLLRKHAGSPVILKGDDGIVTKPTFKPPVEITIVAKTNDTNLRIGYAADQVIFNWERDLRDLRVDGGPANGKNKEGAGAIPTKTYITIRWVVTANKQSIYVNDELRYENEADYSKIDNPVSVASHRSIVTVKSIRVKHLPDGPE